MNDNYRTVERFVSNLLENKSVSNYIQENQFNVFKNVPSKLVVDLTNEYNISENNTTQETLSPKFPELSFSLLFHFYLNDTFFVSIGLFVPIFVTLDCYPSHYFSPPL